MRNWVILQRAIKNPRRIGSNQIQRTKEKAIVKAKEAIKIRNKGVVEIENHSKGQRNREVRLGKPAISYNN